MLVQIWQIHLQCPLCCAARAVDSITSVQQHQSKTMNNEPTLSQGFSGLVRVREQFGFDTHLPGVRTVSKKSGKGYCGA
jgi:hypothetical protein